MNFDDAIKAHASWKMRLKNYIAKPDGTLHAATVCKDDLCDLGKWIYGEGQSICSKDPDFPSLKIEHARFHKAAADIIIKADSGKNVSEDIALGANSEFGHTSSAITTILMKMKRTSAAA